MAADWFHQIRESQLLADRMAEQIPQLLADPDLTPAQANDIFVNVHHYCLRIERMIEEMEHHEVSDNLLDAAENLDDKWNRIAEVVADRLVDMRSH